MRLPTVLLDVFAVTLFLYILYTVMALSALLEAPESALPPIELGTAKAHAGTQRTESMTVTVSENATQEIIYHLNATVTGTTIQNVYHKCQMLRLVYRLQTLCQ